MSTPSLAPESQPTAEGDTRLYCSFEAASLREALRVATELRKITDAALVRRRRSPGAEHGDWVVTLTTSPLPLTLGVVVLWEGRMLAAERRWPGCRFLGWTTYPTAQAPHRAFEETPVRDASGPGQRRSQRELVVASLLRCPPDEQLGIARGRVVPR